MKRHLLLLTAALVVLAGAPASAGVLGGGTAGPVAVERHTDSGKWACAGVSGVAGVCINNPFDHLPPGSVFDWLP